MRLKPVARKSLSDAVFDQLSQEIVQGRMRPGTPLPSERSLCDMLRVNRGAVREALKRLSQAGLILIQHGGGTRVLDFKQTASLDLLDHLLFRHDGTIDLRVARSVMEMRAVMAPDIARLAARRRGPAATAGSARRAVQPRDGAVRLPRDRGRRARVSVSRRPRVAAQRSSRAPQGALVVALLAPGLGACAPPAPTWREPVTGMELVFVPAGTFTMGSDAAFPFA